MYAFLLFPYNMLVCHMKVEIGVTYAILDILKETDWMLFQPSADNFATFWLFSSTFHEIISIDVSKKLHVMLRSLGICNKNVASSSGQYLWNRSVRPCVVFVLIN